MASDDDGKWHLDKKVPIGLMISLALNAALGIWYASKLDSRITYLENDGIKAGVATETLRQGIEGPEGLRVHLTRTEEKADSVLVILRRWETRGQDGPAISEPRH